MRGQIGKRALHQAAESARARGKPVMFYDEALKGFGARITPAGAVSFFFEYQLGGRQGKSRRMSLGRLGDLTPDQARREAERLRGQMLQGVDVAEERKRKRAQQTALTFTEAAERYLSAEGRGKVSWDETRRLLAHDAIPVLGDRPLHGITRSDIAGLIDDVKARAPISARALFAALRPLFRWALERDLIQLNPCDGLRAPAPPKARDRVLSPAEIAALWHSADRIGYPFGPLWQMLLLTGQRLNEVAGMRWSELDLDQGIWILPGEILDETGNKIRGTKTGAAHEIDLSPQAIDVLSVCPRQSGPYVFSTTGHAPVSGISKAKARLDRLMAETLGEPPQAWRNHDIRRSVATHMAEQLDIDEGVIERILNHVQQGIKAVYQRQQYRARRREALLAWGAFMARLTANDC
jgi:integrase